MIDIPVVLVLGAGASYPYGFPLGSGLTKEVLSLSGDDVKKVLTQVDKGLFTELQEFQSSFRYARRKSIDAYLEGKRKYERIGKLVIAYLLIKRESEDTLYHVESEADWYQHLIEEMMLTESFDGFRNNKLSILTYNYDRSLEYYLFKMLQQFDKSDDECREAMEEIPILHLHGQIGLLPQLHGEGRGYNDIDRYDPDKLQLAAEGIRIVHEESLDEDLIFIKARKLLSEAHLVIFLGFGYLAKNVVRLTLQDNRMKDTTYWGTGVDVKEAETRRYARLFPGELPAGATKRITIDTEVEGIKEYMRKHEYLFME